MTEVRKATYGEIAAAVARLDAAGVPRAEQAKALGTNRPGTISDWLGMTPSGKSRVPFARLEAIVAELLGHAPIDPLHDYAALLVDIEGDARRILERVESAQRAMRGEATPPIAPASLAEGEAHAHRKGGGSAPAQGAQEPTKRRRHRAAGES